MLVSVSCLLILKLLRFSWLCTWQVIFCCILHILFVMLGHCQPCMIFYISAGIILFRLCAGTGLLCGLGFQWQLNFRAFAELFLSASFIWYHQSLEGAEELPQSLSSDAARWGKVVLAYGASLLVVGDFLCWSCQDTHCFRWRKRVSCLCHPPLLITLGHLVWISWWRKGDWGSSGKVCTFPLTYCRGPPDPYLLPLLPRVPGIASEVSLIWEEEWAYLGCPLLLAFGLRTLTQSRFSVGLV